MEPTVLATIVAQYFFTKATDGAIEKLGEDFVEHLYGLKLTVRNWLKTDNRRKEAALEPQVLEAELLEDFSKNKNTPFKGELENFVKKLQSIEKIETININASQRTQQGSSQIIGSMKDSQMAGGNQQNNFR